MEQGGEVQGWGGGKDKCGNQGRKFSYFVYGASQICGLHCGLPSTLCSQILRVVYTITKGLSDQTLRSQFDKTVQYI